MGELVGYGDLETSSAWGLVPYGLLQCVVVVVRPLDSKVQQVSREGGLLSPADPTDYLPVDNLIQILPMTATKLEMQPLATSLVSLATAG